MSLQEDRIADRLNLPLMGMAVAMIGLGFVLTILFVTMWIGLPMMALGVMWAIGLYYSAKIRAGSHHLM